jgi:hypothetical protein
LIYKIIYSKSPPVDVLSKVAIVITGSRQKGSSYHGHARGSDGVYYEGEEGRRRSADTLARSIRLYAAEISKQQEKESPSTERPKPQWSRPPEGTVKLNCDASFKADSKTGTVGVSSYVIMRAM